MTTEMWVIKLIHGKVTGPLVRRPSTPIDTFTTLSSPSSIVLQETAKDRNPSSWSFLWVNDRLPSTSGSSWPRRMEAQHPGEGGHMFPYTHKYEVFFSTFIEDQNNGDVWDRVAPVGGGNPKKRICWPSMGEVTGSLYGVEYSHHTHSWKGLREGVL